MTSAQAALLLSGDFFQCTSCSTEQRLEFIVTADHFLPSLSLHPKGVSGARGMFCSTIDPVLSGTGGGQY